MLLSGFGNYHQSEALPGALPLNQNSPQQCSYGLYAEQLSGSAFTVPRLNNLHSWVYRIQPSVIVSDFIPYQHSFALDFNECQPPNPFRWSPFDIQPSVDFIDGLIHIAGHSYLNAFIYQFNQSMENRYFCNNDGEMLFVPYEGIVQCFSEFGQLQLVPGHIAVIPRGVRFKLSLISHSAAGYLCENSGAPLTLPNLGILGANALAHPRHFIYPSASYEQTTDDKLLICKYNHKLWQSAPCHSPLNVVAWHGNYAPYSYDLSLFNTINTVSFDHPDPSIFTVLSSPSANPDVANLDFVIFPSRWSVAEHTFRPPYFHRNIMSELMGVIKGQYEAKAEGFLPGGISIHNSMTAHGPDAASYLAASKKELAPVWIDDALAFMFETNQPWAISTYAFNHPARQLDYPSCWQGIKAQFDPTKP